MQHVAQTQNKQESIEFKGQVDWSSTTGLGKLYHFYYLHPCVAANKSMTVSRQFLTMTKNNSIYYCIHQHALYQQYITIVVFSTQKYLVNLDTNYDRLCHTIQNTIQTFYSNYQTYFYQQ